MILINLIYKELLNLRDVKPWVYSTLNISISLIPLLFALFYPKIGSILSYAASVSGFFMIYLIPVLAYMRMRRLEITHPLLAAALQ